MLPQNHFKLGKLSLAGRVGSILQQKLSQIFKLVKLFSVASSTKSRVMKCGFLIKMNVPRDIASICKLTNLANDDRLIA